MKKILIFIVILFVITACGSGGANTETVNVNIEATQAAEAIQYTREAEAVLYTREAEAALYTREAEANSEAVVEVVTTTPTNTPLGPTNTPTSVPPTPTPTQDPRLFWDDFENGVKPEWGMSGEGYAAVNGYLALENGWAETENIGNENWHNYELVFDELKTSPGGCRESSIEIQVRVQDRDNYMLLRATHRGNQQIWEWYRVLNGQEEIISGARIKDYYCNGPPSSMKHVTKIEVENDVYRTYFDHERAVYFSDNSFENGGFRMRFTGGPVMGGIEVRQLR